MKILLWVFLLFSQITFSQNHFYGVLLDAQTKEEIPFGHFNYDSNKGFISDDRGHFDLYANRETIQINVSAIGYLNKNFLLKANTKNTIALSPKTENLEEVILDYVDPAKELIRKVVAAIPANYPTQQEQVYGTYQEHAYWDSLQTKPIYKAETLTKADKFSYAKKNSDGNVQIQEHKIDVIDLDSVELRIYGGVHNVHHGDYVMARSGPLNLNKLNNYTLKIKDTLEYNGHPVIQLNFSHKKSKGELYIDANSFAVIRSIRELNPKEIKEDFNLFKIYERQFGKTITSYEMDPDGKWRLKFIHHKTGFKRKNNSKSFYLNTTYFATQNLPEAILIPQKERFSYNAILSDFLLNKNENQDSFSKKLRFISFLGKLKFSYGLGVQPFQIESHQFHFNATENYINQETTLSELIFVYHNKIVYNLNNQFGISANSATSLKKKRYESYAVGLDFKYDLSKRNRVHFNSSLGLGFRKIRAFHGTFSFDQAFELNRKKFDSGELSLYTEERNLFLQPTIGIHFKVKRIIHLGVEASYFIPFTSTNGIFSQEEKEFWFWNRAASFQKLTNKNLIRNDFMLGATLTLRL